MTVILSDAYNIIVSYINSIKDLLSWRYTCRSHFRKYVVYFECSNFYQFIIPINVVINRNTNLTLLKYNDQIKYLKISRNKSKHQKYINERFTNEHLLHLKNLEYLEIEGYYKYGDGEVSCMSPSLTLTGFINLSKLKTLHCKDMVFLTNDILNNLPNLTDLDCSNCNFVTHHGLRHLTNLTKLVCNGNDSLDSCFVQYLTKLEYLTIDYDIQNNYDLLIPLVNLKILQAPTDNINPNIIKVLPKLERVICYNNEFTDIHIQHLYNLKELVCGPNSFFTGLSLDKFSNLEKFSITNTNIELFVFTFRKFTYLKEFHSGNAHIPDHLFKDLKFMESLYCDNNITLTDKCLEFMPNLTELNCGNNNSFTDYAVSKLKKLKDLNCVSNVLLTDLTLTSLPNLTRLSCGINRNFKDGLKTISRQLEYISYMNRIDDELLHKDFIQIVKSIEQHNKKRYNI